MTADIEAAEDALQRGFVEEALAQARAALKQGQQQQRSPTTAAGDSGDDALGHLARAINVIIQADFHFHNRLTDLEQLLKDTGVELSSLPVHVVLLWGVVAVELQAAELARATLGRYLGCREFGEGSGVTREDALALSRLYAVQLLAGLCHDFEAAAAWLDAGGAGLSEEQQELLLMEVEEAEELVQEEHLAAWTIQHASEATQHGAGLPHPPNGSSNGAATGGYGGGRGGASAAGCDGASTVSSVVASSVASAAAAAAMQELGPSASGVLSGCPSSALHPEGSGGAEELGHGELGGEGGAAAVHGGGGSGSGGAQGAAARGGGSTGSSCAQGQQQQHEAAEQRSAGAAAAAAGPPVVSVAAAAAAAGFPVEDDREPTSPSLAGWRTPDADESFMPDQGCNDDNPYVTMTGDFIPEGEASAAAGGHHPPSSKAGSPLRPDSGRSAAAASSAKAAGAGGRAAAKAASALETAAAAVQQEIEPQQDEGEQPQQPVSHHHQQQQQQFEQAPQQQQQQLSSWLQQYSSWASSKAAEVWDSSGVQGTLRALHLQDVPPIELAGGAGLALLVGYSLYRKRRNLRRAAAGLAAGIADTGRMALGLGRPPNAMAAAPGTGHLMR